MFIVIELYLMYIWRALAWLCRRGSKGKFLDFCDSKREVTFSMVFSLSRFIGLFS